MDASTNDLAVANQFGSKPGTAGSVTIFPHATGPAQVLSISNMLLYFFCTYDDQGNLFVDGQDSNFNVVIAEKAKGAAGFSALTLVGLPKNFRYPGGIFWDGRAIAVADYDRGIVYRLRISNSRATVIASTRLAQANGLEGFSIVPYSHAPAFGPYIVGPNNGANTTMMWAYPKGGSPLRTFPGFNGAISAVVSSMPTPSPSPSAYDAAM